jgi:hypothetical protein
MYVMQKHWPSNHDTTQPIPMPIHDIALPGDQRQQRQQGAHQIKVKAQLDLHWGPRWF